MQCVLYVFGAVGWVAWITGRLLGFRGVAEWVCVVACVLGCVIGSVGWVGAVCGC